MKKHLHGVHSAMMVARGGAKDHKQDSLEDVVVVAHNFKRHSIFWQLMTDQVLFTLYNIVV